MVPKYSVLTYNVGGYEIVHEIQEKSPNAEYIYITDDPNIKSETWQVVCVDNPHPEDPFDLCYRIRFNPFDYINSNIVFRVDGSIGINKNLDPIIEAFEASQYDCAMKVHPLRNTMFQEYQAWLAQRQYPLEQANRCLAFMDRMEGYDIKGYKGLFEYNIAIQRKNRVNLLWNEMTWALLKYLAPEGKQVERLDQTLGSFVANKYFNFMKVMALPDHLVRGSYMTWYGHGSNKPLGQLPYLIPPYVFNKPIVPVTL